MIKNYLNIQIQGLFFHKSNPLLRNLTSRTLIHNLPDSFTNAQASKFWCIGESLNRSVIKEVFFAHEKDKYLVTNIS